MGNLLGRFAGWALGLGAAALLLFGHRPAVYKLPDGAEVKGRVVVTYWEKWTGKEFDALQSVVDKYNSMQGSADGVFVEALPVSLINQKLLITIAGGDPPDIAGLWAAQTGPYAESGAILPLDELVANGTILPPVKTQVAGVETWVPGTYKPYVWETRAPDGKRLYAVASTPATCALFYNKDMLAAAGIEHPPATMAELDADARKMERMGPHGELEVAGFLPNEPGWWDYYWGIYFGNKLYDKPTDTFHIDTPQQVEAYRWYQGYAKRLGADEVQKFKNGFGNFNSPENAFLSGKVAMEVQGPFFANFIKWNKPEMVGHYGVVPMPCKVGEPGRMTLGDLDTLVIPRGAKHKQAALKFLEYVCRQDVMEALCTAHSKPSPLMKVSAGFIKNHPNPYIDVFEKAMMAPQVNVMPGSPSWERVLGELRNATERILDGENVEAVLQEKQAACDGITAEEHERRERRNEER